MPRSKARKKNKNNIQRTDIQKNIQVKKISRLEKSKYRRENRTPELRILKDVSNTLGIMIPHLEKPKPELLNRILRTPRLIPDLKLDKSRWANRQHFKSLDLAHQIPVIEGPIHMPFQGDRKLQILLNLYSLPIYQSLETTIILIGSLFSFETLKEKNSHWHLTADNYLSLLAKIFEIQGENSEFQAWLKNTYIYHQTISHFHFFGPERMIKLWDLLAKIQSPNQITRSGHTPLSLLCSHLAHPLHSDQNFFTVEDDRKPLIKWLLDKKVDPNTVEIGDQFSPLEEICGIAKFHKSKGKIAAFTEKDREEIIKMLCEAGANPKGHENKNLRPVTTVIKVCKNEKRRSRLIKYLTDKGDNETDLTEICTKMIEKGEKLDHKVIQLLKYQGRLKGLDDMFLKGFMENQPGTCDKVLDFMGGELTISLQDVITQLAQPRSKQLKTVDVFSFQPYQPQNVDVALEKKMAQCVNIGKRFLDSDKKASNNQCYICMESVGGQVTRGCDNGHYFHEECIMTWLKKEKTCPTCRLSLSSDAPWVRLRELSLEEQKAIDEEEERVNAAIAKKKQEDEEAQKKAKILAEAQAKNSAAVQAQAQPQAVATN